MHALHIALQEGFSHDEVLLRLDSARVYHGHDIATRQQIGLAASFDTQAASGTHTLELCMPARGILHSHDVELQGDTWVGISVTNDQVCMRIGAMPFGYA